MDIYLDNSPLATDADTLGGIIDAGLADLDRERRMIVEVRLDGRTLKADELEQLITQPLTAQEVQLITADNRTLAEQTLADVGDALRSLADHQQKAAELLQSDQPGEAMEPIKHALAIWQQVQQSVLQTSQLMAIDLQTVSVGDRAATALIGALAEQLRAIRDQMVNQDWVALADSLAYELGDVVADWHELIGSLREQVAAMGDGA